MALAGVVACSSEDDPARPLTPPPPPRTVVLITIDTLRADFVSFFGQEPLTTPFLDRMASEGVAFRDAYAPSSWTVPSMASLMTGLAPRSHGVVSGRVANREDTTAQVVLQPVLAPSLTTLAEAFRAAGYRTLGVPANLHLSRQLGFGQGFDHYASPEFRAASIVNRDTVALLEEAFGADWRNAWKREKTFLWIHYVDPHDPYQLQSAWTGKYAPDIATQMAQYPVSVPMQTLRERHPQPDAAFVARLSALYRAEVAYTDDQIRELAERIGLADDGLLLVVTSDHGEELADHAGLGHGLTLYEELLRVPLLVRWPAAIPPRAPIEGPASLLDVLPTLAELAELRVPDGLPGQTLAGALLRGEALPERTLAFELDRPRTKAVAVRDGNWKLVMGPGTRSKAAELFDLAQDPGETRNLAAQHPEIAARLRNSLHARVTRYAAPPSELEMVPLDDASAAQLRALGYVD